MTMQPARVQVVIVNYKTGRLAVDCLRSLVEEVAAVPGTVVTVVDNRSGDDSVEVIGRAIEAQGWSSWARLLPAPVNGGFSYGNNFAVRPTLADPNGPAYYWLLNPDTRVKPGALRTLVDFLDAHPQAGIAGSRFLLESGEPWPYAFHFPSIWSELAGGLRLSLVARLLKHRAGLREMGPEPAEADWLPGASLLVRREVFQAIGLMDEGYFLYFEETDFCLAARRAGWQTWHVPHSVVLHLVGQSTQVSGHHAAKNRRPAYWFESRRRYWVKNHGWLYAAATDVVWVLAFLTYRLRSVVQRKSGEYPPHFLGDFLRHSALFHRGLPGNPAVSSSPAHGHPDRSPQR
jgi:GT2 family glycosyltransferase